MRSRYILGMDRPESDALLTELAEHLCDETYAYWHHWAKDDMVVWDNWRVIHGAAGVPLDCRRVAQRMTIVGDYKVGRYLDPELDRDRKVRRIIDWSAFTSDLLNHCPGNNQQQRAAPNV